MTITARPLGRVKRSIAGSAIGVGGRAAGGWMSSFLPAHGSGSALGVAVAVGLTGLAAAVALTGSSPGKVGVVISPSPILDGPHEPTSRTNASIPKARFTGHLPRTA